MSQQQMAMAEDMVERVARAIDMACMDTLSPFVSREAARAAIEAMREPTEAMLKALTPDGIPGPRLYQAECSRLWRAMIDFALGNPAAEKSP